MAQIVPLHQRCSILKKKNGKFSKDRTKKRSYRKKIIQISNQNSLPTHWKKQILPFEFFRKYVLKVPKILFLKHCSFCNFSTSFFACGGEGKRWGHMDDSLVLVRHDVECLVGTGQQFEEGGDHVTQTLRLGRGHAHPVYDRPHTRRLPSSPVPPANYVITIHYVIAIHYVITIGNPSRTPVHFLQVSCRSGTYQTLYVRILQVSYISDKPVRFWQIRHFLQIQKVLARFLQVQTFLA